MSTNVQALLSTILALLSGLLGAIIGGVIAGQHSRAGSIEGARIATAHAAELFNKERELREAERRRQIRQAFLEEIKLNTEIVGTRLGASFARLLTGAWVAAQGDLQLLSTETSKKLTEAYARIHRYNDGVSGWDRTTEVSDPINKEAGNLKSQMQEIIQLLERDSR